MEITTSGHLRSEVGDTVAGGGRTAPVQLPTEAEQEPAASAVDPEARKRYHNAIWDAVNSDTEVRPDLQILRAADGFSRDWIDDVSRRQQHRLLKAKLERLDADEAKADEIEDAPPFDGGLVKDCKTIAALAGALAAYEKGKAAEHENTSRAVSLRTSASATRINALRAIRELADPAIERQIRELRGQIAALSMPVPGLSRRANVILRIVELEKDVERWGLGDVRAGDPGIRTILGAGDPLGDTLRAAGKLPPRENTGRSVKARELFEQGKKELARLRAHEVDALAAGQQLDEINNQVGEIAVQIRDLENSQLLEENIRWNI